MIKKITKTAAFAVAALAFGCIAVACDGEPDDDSQPGPQGTTYTITYDLNGGTGNAPTEDAKKDGAKFDLATDDGFSKTDYTFIGWLCDADNVTYDAEVKFTMPDKNVKFTAQWTYNKIDSAEAWAAAFDFKDVKNATVTFNGYKHFDVYTEYDNDKFHSIVKEIVDEGEKGREEEFYCVYKSDEPFSEDEPEGGTQYLYEYDGVAKRWGLRKSGRRLDTMQRDVDSMCDFTATYNEEKEEQEGFLYDRFVDFEYNAEKGVYENKITDMGYYTNVKITLVFRDGKLYDGTLYGEASNEEDGEVETWTREESMYIRNIGTTVVTVPEEALAAKAVYYAYFLSDVGDDYYWYELMKEENEKFTLDAPDAVEGYEFIGWKCSDDGEVYKAGFEYTMPAYDVDFEAVWESNASDKIGSAAAWKAAFDFTDVKNATVTFNGYKDADLYTEYDNDKQYQKAKEIVVDGRKGRIKEDYIVLKSDEIFDEEEDPEIGTTYRYEYDFTAQRWGLRKHAMYQWSYLSIDDDISILCRLTSAYNEETEEEEGFLYDRFSDFKYNEKTGKYENTASEMGRYSNVKISVSFKNGKLYDCSIYGEKSWENDDGEIEIYPIEVTMSIRNIGTTVVTVPEEALAAAPVYYVYCEVEGDDYYDSIELSKQEGEKFTLGTPDVTREGYEFAGWLCDADNKTYDADEEIEMPAKDITFIAQWE